MVHKQQGVFHPISDLSEWRGAYPHHAVSSIHVKCPRTPSTLFPLLEIHSITHKVHETDQAPRDNLHSTSKAGVRTAGASKKCRDRLDPFNFESTRRRDSVVLHWDSWAFNTDHEGDSPT